MVDNKKYYEILGVKQDATDKEIKKAYKKLLLEKHPDKGGSHEEFAELQKAYETLSDSSKRESYDKYGEEGEQHHQQHHGAGMGDFFSHMFGAQQEANGKPKGRPVLVQFPVSLEDFFNGGDKEMDWEKRVICSKCEGAGGSDEAKVKCSTCDGQGIVMFVQQIGPMRQMFRQQCPNCHAKGFTIDDDLKCKTCNGEGLEVKQSKLSFTIVPGMRQGERIKLAEEGDKISDDVIPGDVFIELVEKPHSTFKRQGDHLIYVKTLTLLESLIGFEFLIDHIDKRRLKIKSADKEVYKPNTMKVIKGEGMPTARNQVFRGNLVIIFKVDFPDKLDLSDDQKSALEKILGGKTTKWQDEEDEEETKIDETGEVHKKKTKSDPEDVEMIEFSEDLLADSKRESRENVDEGPQVQECNVG